MADEPSVELLLLAHPPIVHVHPRAIPAVAVQGDTLATWLDRVDEALGETDNSAVLTELRSELSACLHVYETALADRGIRLPYQRRPYLPITTRRRAQRAQRPRSSGNYVRWPWPRKTIA